jgi:hypothetical protein
MTKTSLAATLIATAALAIASAQERERVFIQSFGGPPQIHTPAEFEGQTFDFLTTKMAFDGAVVKGAPYSADGITESTQTLGDGNHIRRTTKAGFYRDSEGRTRHEQTLGEIGPLTVSGEPIQTIVINDPVAGTTYMMNSREKTARKMPGKGSLMVKALSELAEAKARHEKELSRTESFSAQSYSITVNRRQGGPDAPEQSNVKKESLGTQMFEGVAADGTRTTITIPAGAVGNERPIEAVTERWYSNQLHITVMTKTIDPRIGETVYQLKNIKLGEPPRTLFEVPSDYTVR